MGNSELIKNSVEDSTGYAESVSDKQPHLFGGSSSGPLLLHYELIKKLLLKGIKEKGRKYEIL